MASYNKIILMGNLTRDPELRYAPSGLAICNFDIAVNSSFGTGANRKEETLFIRIVTFNKQAENCGQYLKKGRPVMVDGRLQISSWDGEDGQKRSRPEVVASMVQFIGGRGEGDFNSSPAGEANIPIEQIIQDPNDGDDDIPF